MPHQGVLEQGEKDVLTLYGVSATADHEILTERGWVEWSEVLKNPSHFQSAIASGNLPACDGTHAACTEKLVATQCSRGSGAHVGGKGISTEATYAAGVPHAVTRVQKQKRTQHVSLKPGWQPYALTPCYATGCWTASAPSSYAAPIRTAQPTLTMGGAVLLSMRRGLQTVLRFCSTLSGSKATTSRIYNSTASTTTEGMSPATCALPHAARTEKTDALIAHAPSKNLNAASTPLRQRMQTYDIALAGPRNRYTILTDAGPIIVHN